MLPVLHLMVHKKILSNLYMKLQKPNLLQYLVTYIVMNLNYFDWYDTIDNSKKMINFKKQLNRITILIGKNEVELVKCSGLNEKAIFLELKKVMKKKLYNLPECKKISDDLVKLIIKKQKVYYSKQVITYEETLLKYLVETNKNLKKLLQGKNLEKKMENINNLIVIYIKERRKDLKKKKNNHMSKYFENRIKECKFIEKEVEEKIVQKKIKELIKANDDNIKQTKNTIKIFKKNMKEIPKLNRQKIFNDYRNMSLPFV